MSGGNRKYSSIPRKRPDVKWALENGWEFYRTTGSGHLMFRHPQVEQAAVLSCSLGGGRGERNGLAWLKRNTPRED